MGKSAKFLVRSTERGVLFYCRNEKLSYSYLIFPPDQALFENDNKSSLTRTEHNSTEVNGSDFLNASVGKRRQTSAFPPVFMNTPVLGVRKKPFEYLNVSSLGMGELLLVFLLGKEIFTRIITIKIQFCACFTP